MKTAPLFRNRQGSATASAAPHFQSSVELTKNTSFLGEAPQLVRLQDTGKHLGGSGGHGASDVML